MKIGIVNDMPLAVVALQQALAHDRALRVIWVARDGADVVQVYAELPDAEAPARLVGFARVEAAVGSHSTFEIDVDLQRLATRNPQTHKWDLPSGPHRVSVGRTAIDPSASAFDLHL